MPIPTVDIAEFLRTGDPRAAVQWHEAFSTVGFCNLVGHGIDPEAIQRLQEDAWAYFRQPREAKMCDCLHKGYGHGGYVPEGVEAELTGFSLIGDRRVDLAPVPRVPGTPRIRVRVFSVIGDAKLRSAR